MSPAERSSQVPGEIPAEIMPGLAGPELDAETRYRTLMERMPDAVVIAGHDYRILYANPAALALWGAAGPEEMIGRSAIDLSAARYGSDTDPTRRMWEDIAATGTAEVVGERFDGTSFDLRVTVIPTRWGDRPAVQAVCRDITVEKRADEERSRYKARIRRILEASSEGVVGLDLDGICTFVNPAAARAVGSEPEAIVGRRWHDQFHHSYADGSPYPVECCQVNIAAREGNPTAVDVDWLWRTDGTRFPVQVWSQPVIEDGAVIGSVVNFADISDRMAAHERLTTSEARFRAVFDGAGAGIGLTDAAGVIIAANPALERLLGRGPGELEGLSSATVMHPDDLAELGERYGELMAGRSDSFETEKRYLHADGSVVWARLKVSAVRDDRGEIEFSVTMIENVTAQRQASEAIAASERRFRSAFHDLGTGMVLGKSDGTLLEVNRALCDLLGYASDELVGLNWLDQIHPDDFHEVRRSALRMLLGKIPTATSEHRVFRRDGDVAWVISTASLLETDGGAPVFLMQVQDITERKRAEAALSFDATHDQLTRLPNRAVLLDELSTALRRQRDHGETVAVLFVDLDHFKLVNDSYGHVTGDEVLIALGERLSRSVGADGMVARFAGDEFIVLSRSPSGEAHAVELAQRLSAAIREPLLVSAGEMQLTASIGIAYGHTDELDPDLVLRDADLAMFEAKARGRARSTVFDDALRGRARYRLETARALRLAIERDELVLHYQPVVDLPTDAMNGVEALVRWQHPAHGLVGPGEFMPVAEETGLIVDLGAWVLDEACRQGAAWSADPDVGEVVISVNLSARQFNDDALVPRVAHALASAGLPPRLLCLEITESAVMDDVDHTGEVLAELRALGVKLSIDDFGTGYSSLSYLKQFPVDTLKVDRSFVDGLGHDVEDTQIVTAVVHLAHALGLTVVAEGVETTAQLEALRGLGCDLVQGFLLARPQTSGALEAWLQARRSRSSAAVPGRSMAGRRLR